MSINIITATNHTIHSQGGNSLHDNRSGEVVITTFDGWQCKTRWHADSSAKLFNYSKIRYSRKSKSRGFLSRSYCGPKDSRFVAQSTEI